MAQYLWFTKLREYGSIVVASISSKLKEIMLSGNITIYPNLKSINITVWHEILKTNNYLLLDTIYSETKKYTIKQNNTLQSHFLALYDEYFKLLNNRKAKVSLITSQEKTALITKINALKNCYNTLLFIRNNYKSIDKPIDKEHKIYENVKLLTKNVHFGKFSDLDENLIKIADIIKSNELSYDRKFPDDKPNEKIYTFEKQLIDVEQVLGRTLNVDHINVVMWVEYLNKVQEIIKIKEGENERRKK